MNYLLTKIHILRCSSLGSLHSFHPSDQALTPIALASDDLWHRRLGHSGQPTMSCLFRSNKIPCPRSSLSLCQDCQLGRHVKLPFQLSRSTTRSLFELIQCDLWVSHILRSTQEKHTTKNMG